MAQRRITATFEVVTPLFPGGADPANTAELRAPSIKGVLRFWWRALAWSRLGGDMGAIRREEARLFGAAGEESADAKESTGQASFILRVVRAKPPESLSKGETLQAGRQVVGAGMRYFGYGLMGAFGANQGKLERPCLPSPFPFSIELVSRDPLDSSVVNALKMLGLLGGLGSRSRRGYGSLSLVSLESDAEAWKPPATRDDYANQVRAVLKSGDLRPADPPYTAFSGKSRIVVVSEDLDPMGLLDRIGKQMQRYRSWGHDGRVNGEESERNFKDDHDWFKNGASASGHPRRVIFGLPHNYSKHVGIPGPNSERQRRASPLSIHVHKLEKGYIGVVSVLPGDFLPPGEKMSIRNGSRETSCMPQVDWRVLDGFIDGMSKDSRRPYFPNQTKILP